MSHCWSIHHGLWMQEQNEWWRVQILYTGESTTPSWKVKGHGHRPYKAHRHKCVMYWWIGE